MGMFELGQPDPEAAATLRRSIAEHARSGGEFAADWAFLAIALHRLDQPDGAVAARTRARTVYETVRESSDEDTQALEEAEALMTVAVQ